MNTTNFNLDVVVAAIIGFVIGAVLVWIISYLSRKKDEDEDDATLQELQALQKEYDQYRTRVNEHFAKTADSIDGLTKSYQQVFDHLSHGAQNLMDSEALQAQLEKRQNKAVTLAYLVEQERKTKQAAQPAAKPASAPQSDVAAAKKQPAADAPAEGVKKTATADKATQAKSNVHLAAEKAGLKPIARPDKQAEAQGKPAAAKQPAPQSKPTVAKQAEPQSKPAPTKQPEAPTKPAVAKQAEPQSKPAPTKQPEAQSKPVAAKQPTPPSKPAAVKQPAPPSKPEPKIIQDEPHETAIEAVKKHIKEDVDKGSSK